MSFAFAWLLFLAGSATLSYPHVAQWWNKGQQQDALIRYSLSVDATQQEKLKTAVAENSTGDTAAALDQIRVAGTEVIGQIAVPSADIDLPIYPTSEPDDLQRGAGHLEGSSAPVGGLGTHAAITAHTGMPTAVMFDRLVDVRKGDVLALSVLGEVLTYRVIRTAVETPEEGWSLLETQADSDLLTLITCTPYGVNSHRLLVTGVRTEESRDGSERGAPVRVQTHGGLPALAAVLALSVGAVAAFVARRAMHARHL